MLAVRTARQECVRISLYSLALAVIAAAVMAIGVGVPPTMALRLIGYVLAVTALAQGVLSWIAQFCGSDEAGFAAALGGISTVSAAGLLLLFSVVI